MFWCVCLEVLAVFKAVVKFLKAEQDLELKLLATAVTNFSVAFDIVIKRFCFQSQCNTGWTDQITK